MHVTVMFSNNRVYLYPGSEVPNNDKCAISSNFQKVSFNKQSLRHLAKIKYSVQKKVLVLVLAADNLLSNFFQTGYQFK